MLEDYSGSGEQMDGLFSPPPAPLEKMSKRDYQKLDEEESFRLWDSGVVGVLTRAATGLGKTFMACLKIRRWLERGDNYRAMVISYERELVWQFALEIEDWLGISPGIEMGGEFVVPGKIPRIVVASRQTLLPHARPSPTLLKDLAEHGITDTGAATEKVCRRILKYLNEGGDPDEIKGDIEYVNSCPEADGGDWSRLHKFDHKFNWLVIFDEAHKHAYKLKSVRHLVDWFDRNPLSRRNGLTATPKRGDAASLGYKMFPGVAIDYPLYHATNPCAVKDGWAVPYVQRYIEVEGVDFRNIKMLGKDFSEADLERILGEEGQLAKLVQPLLEMVGDRQTLIFSPGVEMAKNVARFINARSETECPECHAVAWYPNQLLGVNAACRCGVSLTKEHFTKTGEQARELDGATPEHERKTAYKAHQGGRFQFLSVCGLCVARGTLVMTDCGEVPIEQVTTQMKLWDGVEFVSHGGVIFKGVKPVIHYAGLTATEDHNVWTGDGWERFAACKQQRIAIRVSAIGGEAVRESCGYYRDDHCEPGLAQGTYSGPDGQQSPLRTRKHSLGQPDRTGQQQTTTPPGLQEEVEVYDILNAGPRHRFTANGLIVSNCKEGYNDPDISCVAVFRPVSKKASSLAEQMKGRACRPLRELVALLNSMASAAERVAAIANSDKPNALIVDLVGITGLADCASTAQIYADGLPDEVLALAEEIIEESEGEVNVEEVVEEAQRKVAEEQAKAKAAREEEERLAKERAEFRAKADAAVKYTAHEMGSGTQVDPDLASMAQMKYIRHLGMNILKPINFRQARRIIPMLKARMAPKDVAYRNRLADEHWSPEGPSDGQKWKMKGCGLSPDGVKTGHDASQMIDARLKTAEYMQGKLDAINRCRSAEELTILAKEIGIARKALSAGNFATLVQAGAAKRKQLGSF